MNLDDEDQLLVQNMNDNDDAEETAELYNFQDNGHFKPQEKTAFTALEFKQSDNVIMNPQNNFIINSDNM